MKRSAVAFFSMLVWMLPSAGNALDLEASDIGSGEHLIVASGIIRPGDDERLHRLVSGLPRGSRVVAILLNSSGGNLYEASSLAETVRNSRLITVVGPRNTCASACFLVFAAGVARTAFESARIGVHSVSHSGDDNLLAQAFTTLFARDAAAYGVPAAIIGKLVVTPPDGMTWLSHGELRQMGVQIEPDAAPPSAQAYRRGSALTTGAGATAIPAPSGVLPASPPRAVQGESQAFVDGLTDRTAWEGWISGLGPIARAGAEFWAGQRSLQRPAPCSANASAFEAACVSARQRLTPTDVRRRAEPDYRRGWNAYVATTPSIDQRQTTEAPRSAAGIVAAGSAPLFSAEAVVRPVAAMQQRLRTAGMAGLQVSRQECEQAVARNGSPRSAEYCLILVYSAHLLDRAFMENLGQPDRSTPGWDLNAIQPTLVRMFDVMQVPVTERRARVAAYERWITQALRAP